MLIEFSCSNHRSFKDEVTFSMLAGTDTSMKENFFEFSNYKVLRSAVIYGANGSGKTSFIDALIFMQRMVCTSIMCRPGDKLFQNGFKLNPEDTPSEYDIQFAKNGVRFAYGFSVAKGLVKDEYLYCFPNGKKVTVFDREGMDVKLGNRFVGAFGLAKEALKDNRLFLSCAANYSNVPEVGEAYRFFATDLIVYTERNNWIQYSLRMMKSDPELKDLFVQFLKSLGTNAQDIEIREETVKYGDLPLSQRGDYADTAQELMSRTDETRMKAKVIYGDNFAIDLDMESAGVRRMFQMLCPIIDILRNDKVLVCDELENSLHESIVYQIVQLFQDRSPDRSAQLIFTTHDTDLLDADLFRRDQIWFTQMNEERASDLYSLVEIKDVRKTENKSRQYMNGKYGAIPVLNLKFFEDFKNES